jgi:hypothetical protein
MDTAQAYLTVAGIAAVFVMIVCLMAYFKHLRDKAIHASNMSPEGRYFKPAAANSKRPAQK